MRNHNFGDNLNWSVFTSPTQLVVNGETFTDNNHLAILRDDLSYPKSLLGYVSGGYEIVQNQTILDLCNPLIDAGLGELANVGYLQGGKRIFVQLELHQEFKLLDHEHKSFISILNTHNGSSSLAIGVGNTRIICSNTFLMHQKELDTRFAHIAGINSLLNIDEMLKYINISMAEYQGRVEVLELIKLSDSQVKAAISRVFGDNDKIYNNIVNLYRHGAGNSGRTGYDLFSATTDYLSHKGSDSGKNVANSIAGTSVNKNQKMLDSLLALA